MTVYPGIKLEAILALNVTTAQPHGHIDYVDYGPTGEAAYPNSTTFAMNNSTAVTILSAPMAGQTKVRQVTELMIYNDDTGNISAAIRSSDGTTVRLYVSTVITSSKALLYQSPGGAGWQFNI